MYTEEAYEVYKDYQKFDTAFVINEYLTGAMAINGQIAKAVSIMEGRVPLVLMVEAKKHLSRGEHYQFLQRVKSILNEKSALPPQYAQLFVDLYELGYTDEATELIDNAMEYTEKAKLEDKHGYRRFIEAFIPALVQIGREELAETLLPDETYVYK